jgi:HPt (histidine-containing phosphotransfer) domain-containing protein
MTDPNATLSPTVAMATAPPGDAGATVLDATALASLSQLDPTGASHLMQRVLSTYRDSLERLLSQLTHARRQSDTASLRLVTHTLKSSSASVGALALSVLCGDAEKAIREGQLDKLPPMLDQLAAEAARVDAAVLQLLSDK